MEKNLKINKHLILAALNGCGDSIEKDNIKKLFTENDIFSKDELIDAVSYFNVQILDMLDNICDKMDKLTESFNSKKWC